jgi:hypothetical protein
MKRVPSPVLSSQASGEQAQGRRVWSSSSGGGGEVALACPLSMPQAPPPDTHISVKIEKGSQCTCLQQSQRPAWPRRPSTVGARRECAHCVCQLGTRRLAPRPRPPDAWLRCVVVIAGVAACAAAAADATAGCVAAQLLQSKPAAPGCRPAVCRRQRCVCLAAYERCLPACWGGALPSPRRRPHRP